MYNNSLNRSTSSNNVRSMFVPRQRDACVVCTRGRSMTQPAQMSFDDILDITAGVFFFKYI